MTSIASASDENKVPNERKQKRIHSHKARKVQVDRFGFTYKTPFIQQQYIPDPTKPRIILSPIPAELLNDKNRCNSSASTSPTPLKRKYVYSPLEISLVEKKRKHLNYKRMMILFLILVTIIAIILIFIPLSYSLLI